MNGFQVQALIAFLFPVLLQLAKRSQSRAFAWVDQNNVKFNIFISMMVSLGTNMGLTIAHTQHSVTISWIDLATAVHGLLNFTFTVLLQFCVQHVSYDSFWRHVVPSPSNQTVKLLRIPHMTINSNDFQTQPIVNSPYITLQPLPDAKSTSTQIENGAIGDRNTSQTTSKS